MTEHLVCRGFTVRERNWRPPHSHKEVDLIVQKEGVIAFVEVKGRQNDDYDPIDAVDMKKIRNVVRAADSYLRGLDEMYEYRFDIALVTGTPDDYKLEYIEDAFLPPYS